MTTKPKREKRYKNKLQVLDNGSIRGVCSCGWEGNAFAQTSGVSAAMAAAQSELQGHKHIPAPPKTRKNAKKPGKPIEGVV